MKTNKQYWQDRFIAVEHMRNRQAKDTVDAVTPAFDSAMREIENQINTWYNRYSINNQISLAEAKRQLSARELKELRWDIGEYIAMGEQNALDPKWMKQLENASARYHISRLEALKIRTQQAAEVAFGNELDELDQMLSQAYTESYYHTAYEIQKGLGIAWDIGQLDQARLTKILKKPWTVDGYTFSNRIWKSKQQLIEAVSTEMTQMCILGGKPDQAIKNLAHKMQVSKSQAGRLIMTESAYFGSKAQKDCFNDLDVEKYEIVATLDLHTSEICQAMDGKVFKMSDFEPGVTAPPFHPWCRTVTCPFFDDEFTADETRAARGEDGKTYQVPSSMKYPDWKATFVDKTKDPVNLVKPASPKKGVLTSLDDCQSTDDVVKLMKSHDDWFYKQTINGKVYDSKDGINLDDVDLDCAKAVYEPFEMLFNRFPNLKGKLNSVNSSKLSSFTYAQCNFGLGHGGIAVNKKFYSDYEKMKKSVANDVAGGWHPKGTESVSSIVMHELGHAVDDYLTHTEMMAGMTGWKPKKVSAMLRPKVMKACGLKVSDVRKEVSEYATKDCLEWFAECFCEYMISENPRPVAKKFGEELEAMLKEVK